MRVLRWLVAILGIAIAGVLLLAIGSRFADGPIAALPGGALTSGEWVETTVEDWGFVAPVGEVELQLLEPVRSRTTWILFEDGRTFIPCGAPELRWLKQWPHEAVEDGRSVIRIEGRRYPVTLTRIHDPELEAALVKNAQAKYPVSAGLDSEIWFFELKSRSDRREST